MAIARDEPHGPEMDAANDGNSVIFDSDSPQSIGRALVTLARARESWLGRRERISAECARVHSVEAMVTGILAAVTDCTPLWRVRPTAEQTAREVGP